MVLPGHLTRRLFPHAVLPSLTVLAQVAIVIFMFVVGTNSAGGRYMGGTAFILLAVICAIAFAQAGARVMLLPASAAWARRTPRLLPCLSPREG